MQVAIVGDLYPLDPMLVDGAITPPRVEMIERVVGLVTATAVEDPIAVVVAPVCLSVEEGTARVGVVDEGLFVRLCVLSREVDIRLVSEQKRV